MNKEIKKWTRLSSELLQKTRVFDLYSTRVKSPDGSYEDDFYTIQTVDWVNIVPVTKEREVVLIEQYRHGIDEPTLEIPGGMLDPEETNPMLAAIRELEEETGYHASTAQSLGWIHPNPAIQSNRCHFFVAYDVEAKFEQNLDPAEDIAVRRFPVAAIPELLETHQITHSLVAVALYRFLLQDKLSAP